MTGPGLVVPPSGPGATTGAGLLDSGASVVHATSAAALLTDSELFAIDALGVRKDPLNAMLGAGVGWLIEHISFLREPLDWLAGNPDEIKAHAQTWHNVATRLEQQAQLRESGIGSTGGWQGAAATAYRRAAEDQVHAVRTASRSATELARQTLAAAALVGTVRSTIRGMITSFVASAMGWVVGALAAAAPTLGGSIGVIVAKVVAEACALARQLVRMIAELVRGLARSGAAMHALGAEVDELAGRLGRTADAALGTVGLPASDRLRGLDQQLASRIDGILDPAKQSRAVAISLTRQTSGAGFTESEWSDQPRS